MQPGTHIIASYRSVQPYPARGDFRAASYGGRQARSTADYFYYSELL